MCHQLPWLGCTIEDKTWLSGAISKHLSLNDEYHQMCDMTALPSVMKQCVSGLRGHSLFTFMYNVRRKKLKTHRVIMTAFLRRHLSFTESLIRNGITLITSEQRRRYTSPNTEIVITHFLLIDVARKSNYSSTRAARKCHLIPGSRRSSHRTGTYTGVTNESEHVDQTSTITKFVGLFIQTTNMSSINYHGRFHAWTWKI
jgi:hypothetical protein